MGGGAVEVRYHRLGTPLRLGCLYLVIPLCSGRMRKKGPSCSRSPNDERIAQELQAMKRTTVTSSSIASVGYDPGTSTLEVEFNHGAVYQYFMVPDTVFHEFMRADSLGTFLNTRIKGTYPYVQI